jgi:stage II sporulation protein D
MKKRRNLNAFLNIAIAALSVTAVFTVLTTLELETSETPPISLGTTITVISEPEPIPFSDSGAGGITDETTVTTAPETTPPETATTTAPPPMTIAQTMPLAASNEANSPSEMNFSGVIEDVETTTKAETTVKTTVPSVKTTTAKATTKKVIDLDLHEESEAAEFQLYEEFEEEQSLIIITLPATTTTAATTTTPATSFITGYTDPTTTTAATTANTPTAAIPASDTITARVNGSRGSYNLFDLVCGVVCNEVGTSFDDEAIKAQAIAAYTYMKYYEQNGDTPSVYANFNYPDRIKNLVASVYGKAVYHNGKYAQTVYSASSGGYTASAKNVWGGSIPYLVSVPTPHDVASDPNYGIRKSFTVSQIKSALESGLNITLSDNPANWLYVTERIDGNYVKTVSVDNQKSVSGRELREEIMDYDIRSAAFDVTYDGQNFIFTTYGYGHGVGLSQHGANILAGQGYSYIEILEFYYTGVQIY